MVWHLDSVKHSTPSRLSFDGIASDEEFGEEEDDAEYEQIMIEEEDADVLSKFMPSEPKEKLSLADLIMEKINQKEAADRQGAESGGDDMTPSLSPKVVEVYQK